MSFTVHSWTILVLQSIQTLCVVLELPAYYINDLGLQHKGFQKERLRRKAPDFRLVSLNSEKPIGKIGP